MAKPIEVEQYVKRNESHVDLMVHGSGTPWEDRGDAGIVVAFVKTVIRSIVAPSSLWNNIRRPETRDDAKWFAIGCGIFFSIGLYIQDQMIYLDKSSRDPQVYDTDPTTFGIVVGLKMLICPLLLLLFLSFATSLYHNMVSHTMKFKAPATLTYNLFCYSLGPAIFAMIPYGGWWIAGLWILVNMIRSGIVRQYISPHSSITAGIISVVSYAAILITLTWAVQYFLIENIVYPLVPPSNAHDIHQQ